MYTFREGKPVLSYVGRRMVLVLLYAEVRAIPSGNAQYLVHRKEGAESLIACFSSHKGRSSVHRKEGRRIHSSIDSLATG